MPYRSLGKDPERYVGGSDNLDPINVNSSTQLTGQNVTREWQPLRTAEGEAT